MKTFQNLSNYFNRLTLVPLVLMVALATTASAQTNTDKLIQYLSGLESLGWPKWELSLEERQSHLESIMRLIQDPVDPADPNAASPGGLTSIHAAAFLGNAAAIVKLYELGARLEELYFGYSPLHIATINEQVEVFKTLLQLCVNPNAPDLEKSVRFAALIGNIDMPSLGFASRIRWFSETAATAPAVAIKRMREKSEQDDEKDDCLWNLLLTPRLMSYTPIFHVIHPPQSLRLTCRSVRSRKKLL